jgi:hypothetical protein
VKSRTVSAALLVLIASCITATACSWAVGHFHQVTAIRGHVVGKNLGPFQFRWLRQSFSIKNATLTLFEYRWPAEVADQKPIAITKADANGNFDFGEVAAGHYYLRLQANAPEEMEDLFEVEVTGRVRPTESILIDISPVHPDCSGGHEFIETKAANAT